MSGSDFAGLDFNTLPGYGAPTQSSLFSTFDDATGLSMSSIPFDNLGSFQPPTNEVQLPLYRFRGYYVSGATYEFWTGTSISTPNPSGNPLINKVVDAILSSC